MPRVSHRPRAGAWWISQDIRGQVSEGIRLSKFLNELIGRLRTFTHCLVRRHIPVVYKLEGFRGPAAADRQIVAEPNALAHPTSPWGRIPRLEMSGKPGPVQSDPILKAAVSLLQTYAWMLMGFVYLQGVLQPYRAPLWARIVEVGVALALLALAVWLAPRGEE